ncbi:MAG: hypothetical protein JHD16_17030 [Solirubrobacteraceae bacterium]|nr:hypothetical protein [Solirubrobacteraceae bacterium]
MPPYASALSRAAIPTLALLASATTAAPAQSQTPVPTSPPPVATAAAASGGVGIATVPKSGRLVRITERQLTVSGRVVVVRGRSTTVPIHAELRVGSTGRKVAEADASAGRRFRLQGTASPGERLRLIVTRTDGGVETADVPVGKVRKLRSTTASWYGPGLFGNRTACGQTLTSGLRGVAHKHLPCGTKLTVRYGGRSTHATVVDRGPFHAGREFDLTQATARAIGFHSVGRIWVSGR